MMRKLVKGALDMIEDSLSHLEPRDEQMKVQQLLQVLWEPVR